VRIAALDYGKVRIGFAVTDEAKIIVQTPIPPLRNDKQFFKKIKQTVKDLNIEKIIVGLPVALSGGQTAQTEETQGFVDELRNQLQISIETADERLTSKFSQNMLRESGLSAKEQKQYIDNQSAQIILTNYLKQHEHKK